ncbi:hypothetical protein AAF712_007948 [Marasmius tenuissimus]|uniref:Uncharacterized protein n=1 Tax=Marasmius tenuissimus TaxID=585030 RepID=A0ABR2ZXU7_9AGAR
MALAQRLNELAASHTQGLLNDDEYRLLRQDVFERFSDTTIIPVETHLIPFENHVVPVEVNLSEAGHSQQLKREVKREVGFSPTKAKIMFAEESVQPHRARHATVTAGVASLFRRAIGRKSSRETISSDTDSEPQVTSKSLKKVLIPHLLPRRSNDGTSFRSGSDSVSSYSRSHKTSLSSSTFTPPTSPSKSSHPHREASTSKISVTAAIIGDDIFEDGGLNTTKDIRQAITDLEQEGRNLIDAFNDLERSTITRVYKDRPNARPPLCEAPNPNPNHDSNFSFSFISFRLVTLVVLDTQALDIISHIDISVSAV